MKVRPGLLLASIAVAVAVLGIFVWTQASGNGTGADVLDARLTDPRAVVTYPDDGLVNDDVAGRRLPSVDLLTADGSTVPTADLVGEPLVINLWYSTCAPCAIELPEFAEVDAETDAVRFVGINLQDSADVMERFAAERGVEYELYRDDRASFTDAVGAVVFPVTLFVTSDGTIVEQTGALDAGQLRARIADLLAADGAPT